MDGWVELLPLSLLSPTVRQTPLDATLAAAPLHPRNVIIKATFFLQPNIPYQLPNYQKQKEEERKRNKKTLYNQITIRYPSFVFYIMANNPLSPQNILQGMADALPTHEKGDTTSDLSSSAEAIALFTHACMVNVGFRLLGFNEDQRIGESYLPAHLSTLPDTD